MAEHVCQRWLITGRVQGVGYRAWLVDAAQTHGLVGWVRNLACGAVEALVVGDAESVARLHQACLRGPRGAQVGGIACSAADPGPVMPGTGFRQLRDDA